ncbi:MAG: tetratricopeptide repeat-containing sensor histidine kinase [Cyclobacteriaceae bacterium]|nr:tetratricopeptide repeat-containing sensor histidine kinase [Cyclobacteriaceae bacterium]
MYQIFLGIIKSVRVCLIFICGFLTIGAHAQSYERIDSLKQILRTAERDQRFEIQYALFREYLPIDRDQSLHYISDALEHALALGDSLGIVKASNGKGYIFEYDGNLKGAIVTFEYALEIARRNHYANQIKYILNNLANTHISAASYDKALNYNFESLKIREIEGNPDEIATSLNNIGLVYFGLKDYESALIYFDKSYQVKVKNKITYEFEQSLVNLGLVHNELGNYDKAEERLKEAVAICKTRECKPAVQLEVNQALGVSYLNQKNYTQSEFYFNLAMEFAQKSEIPEYTASNFYWLAKLKYSQQQMEQAVSFLEKSQEICVKMGYRNLTLLNYLLYSKIYADQNDFKMASSYQDRYIRLNEEIFNGDLIKNVSRIQSDYEERKNIKTIAEKDEILELNQEVIGQQRTLNWLLITVIVLTSTLGFVIYRNYRGIKAVNEALASAKRIIEVQNQLLDQQVQDKTKELIDTNESLVKVNDELDNFIYKTSHDIRGPLASLKGIVNLAMMDVKDDKALGYLSKLDLTAEKLNMVLTRLLIVNRINHAELKPETIHFESIIQEILTLEMKKGVPSKIRIEYDVEPEIELTSDREMVRLILENLIDNALKFYNESLRIESFVKIAVRSVDGNVKAHVMDNGVGISQMNREKIFQMFVRASERSETGGIGLYLAKLATEKLGGDINLISTDEKYTEFIVEFPKNLFSIIEKRKEERNRQEQERMQVGRLSAQRPPDFEMI